MGCIVCVLILFLCGLQGSLSEMELTGVDPLINEKGMYRCIDTPQMWVLLECLSKSHQFARQFHSNHEQRVTLMKAGKIRVLVISKHACI